MNKLPDTPSKLLALALVDLKLCEVDPRYKIQMEAIWHMGRGTKETHCKVCFAGAVMAKSLNASIDQLHVPGHFDGDTNNKLNALDSFRIGEIKEAFDVLGIEKPMDLPDRVPYAVYEINKEAFLDKMLDLILLLEDHGL